MVGKNTIKSAVAGIAVFGFAGTALAAVHGEFNDMCTTGLAMHKQVQSDCTSRATYNGKTYCFGNQKAEVMFFTMGPDQMLAKAEDYWKQIHKDTAKN